MWNMYLVYGTDFNNVLAIFPRTASGLSHAEQYVAANGGTIVGGEIPLPFYATPKIAVTPSA